MWGHSLQFWQSVVFWLWALTAVGGGVAVTGSLISAIVSNSVAEETQRQADVRIADANKEATKARSEAALANEITRSLENEVAQAKLETARIQELVRWRTVTPSDAQVLHKQLQGLTLTLQIKAQLSDPEAITYAYSLHSVLRDVGIDVGRLSSTDRSFLFGIRLSGPDTEILRRLQAAFTEIGIKVELQAGETYVLSIGSRLPDIIVPKIETVP